jgi:hypothetical protein
LCSQIFLVDDAILADDEGHDAGVAVLRRISQNGEATGHLSVNEVVFSATLCAGSLLGGDSKIVSIERLRLFACAGVAQ